MAKDPSKKGIRKIPEGFLDWIEDTYNKETRTWYKTNAGRSKAFASKARINLSEEAGKVGAYHEGHFQGAKDIDVEQGMGGGPTTGRTMRSEIGVLNVAHAEKPRIPKSDMRRLGIPQYWLEDFYEALLEAEGQKVIGNLDEIAAMDIDAGMPVEQAAAQSRMRDDLRRQGVEIPGARPTYQNKPAPLPADITEQAVPPKFDTSDIKKTGEVKVTPRTSRIPKVPQNPVEFVAGTVRLGKNIARFIPGPLDDAPMAALVGGTVGVLSLAGGASPTQAAELAGGAAVDVFTDPGGIPGSGAGERFYPDGMERQSPEGLARAKREREEAFQQSVVQPFNQVMNFVGGVVKMIPSGVGF